MHKSLLIAGLLFSNVAFCATTYTSEPPSAISMVIKMVICLGLVIGSIFLFAKVYKGMPKGMLNNNNFINIIEVKRITQTENVSIVEVDGVWFVLASSGNSVTHLHSMKPIVKETAKAVEKITFSDAFKKILKEKINK